MHNHQLFFLVLGSILLSMSDCVYTAAAMPNVTVAKQQAVSGTVKDATGMPIIGASVFVKGSNNGTITDVDGKILP